MTDESEAASGCSSASENCDSDGEYSYHDSDDSDDEAIKPAYDEADALAAALHETEWDDLARQLARSEAEAERRMMEWEKALTERHRAETSERLKMEQQEKKERMIARILEGLFRDPDAARFAAFLSTRDHTVTEADVRGGAGRPFSPFVREDHRRRAHERPSSATPRRAGPQAGGARGFLGGGAAARFDEGETMERIGTEGALAQKDAREEERATGHGLGGQGEASEGIYLCWFSGQPVQYRTMHNASARLPRLDVHTAHSQNFCLSGFQRPLGLCYKWRYADFRSHIDGMPCRKFAAAKTCGMSLYKARVRPMCGAEPLPSKYGPAEPRDAFLHLRRHQGLQ